MSFPTDVVIEVRKSGSDTQCSGGFSTSSKGATGVDYSQQSAAQATFSGTLSASGTTTINNSAATFSNLYLGNVILVVVAQLTSTATSGGSNTLTDTTKAWTTNQWVSGGNPTVYWVTITGGTGAGQQLPIQSNTATVLTVARNWTTQPDATSTYRIDLYDSFVLTGYTSTSAMTIDRAATFASVTGYIGGAKATPQVGIFTTGNGGNAVWAKDDGSAYTSLYGMSTSAPVPGSSAISLRGYGTTRGDTGRPTFQVQAGTGIAVVIGRGDGTTVRTANLIFDLNSTTATAIQFVNNQPDHFCYKCDFNNGSGGYAVFSSGGRLVSCYFYNFTTSAVNANYTITDCTFDTCNSANNTGVVAGPNVRVVNTTFKNCTGFAVINWSGNAGPNSNLLVENCTIHGTCTYGVFAYLGLAYQTGTGGLSVINNLIGSTGTAMANGIDVTIIGTICGSHIEGNDFWNVTTPITDANATQDIYGDRTTNRTLTASPWNADLTLNNVSGGGALSRGSSLPTTPPGTSLTQYRDRGAYQHQDSGSGGIKRVNFDSGGF